MSGDPGELKNLVRLRDPEFIKESDGLKAWYGEWQDKTVVGSISVMTEEDFAKFRALGYVDGGSENDDKNEPDGQ